MRTPAAMLAMACLALLMVPSSSFAPTFQITFPSLRLRATSPLIRTSRTPLLMKSGGGEMKGDVRGSQNDDSQKKKRHLHNDAFWEIFGMANSEEVDTEGGLDNHANQLKRNLDAYSDSNPAEVDTTDTLDEESQTKPSSDTDRRMDTTVVSDDSDEDADKPDTPSRYQRSSPW